MTTQRTITLPADQWEAILESVECHCDEGPPGEGWKSPKLSAAAAALSSALEQPKLEPEGPTDEELRRRFLTWWREEGSAMRPHPEHDHEEHARRISEIAWVNGAYVARWGHFIQQGCTQLP